MSDNLVPVPVFTLEVKGVALNKGASPDHPRFQGRFARYVANMVADGLVPATRIRNRWYVDPTHAHRAAEIMGLIPTEEYRALTRWQKTKNPPTAANG